MTKRRLFLAFFGSLAVACSSDSGSSQGAGGGAALGASTGGASSVDNGSLRAFTPPRDPGPGGILFAASGEALALTGYDFPPATADAAAFVDGWEVKFTRLLVTIDKITLSANPDAQIDDQSVTGGVVAEADGPWAVDVAHADPSYLAGKGGNGEEAVPITALSAQNRNGNRSFDTNGGTRYAFGFDTVSATNAAYNVNLDAEGLADYTQMTANGCVVLYVGTAEFKGDKTDPSCYPPERDAAHGWPDTVTFKLCFKSPTSYVNCQNPDNFPAPPVNLNEEDERGIAFLTNSSVVGQVTIHTDHPFWDSTVHDVPPHFDQFAARAVGLDAGTPEVTLEMTKGVDYTSYTDALGRRLDWRYCMTPPVDVHPELAGPMAFNPHGVPHALGNDARTGLRDYYDFATYDQSTQGHLNSDGLCYVKRNYPSPN